MPDVGEVCTTQANLVQCTNILQSQFVQKLLYNIFIFLGDSAALFITLQDMVYFTETFPHVHIFQLLKTAHCTLSQKYIQNLGIKKESVTTDGAYETV